MAYDSQRGRTVLFAGANTTGYLGDTWEWDGTSWTLGSATGPTPRAGHAMAYDSRRGRTTLFGGADITGLQGDTWEWDGVTWTQLLVAGPAPRYAHSMANDGGRTVLFGGNRTADTWEWDGSTWAQSPSATPLGRFYAAMAYDSQQGRTIMFGGDAGGSETWYWVGGSGAASTFGNGCGSPALTLSLVANARPVINTTASATLANIPSSLAFVALGWSNTAFGPFALPLTLAGYGLPGCSLLTSSEFSALPVTFTGPGTATFDLPLPNINALIGLHVYLQAWANAPGANAGDLIVSNGVEWVIG